MLLLLVGTYQRRYLSVNLIGNGQESIVFTWSKQWSNEAQNVQKRPKKPCQQTQTILRHLLFVLWTSQIISID